jgi:uncharacterized Zn finger protein
MLSYPSITKSTIRSLVGSASFERGERYYRQGAIRNPRVQGRQLKAQCLGTSAHSYRVEVTFGDGNVAATDCSCPVGGGCKHVAALLLAWIAEQDDFARVEETSTVLERRTKDELIALVRLMLARYPDLETLLELPLPNPSKKHKPLDAELIRRQVASVVDIESDDWEGGPDVVRALVPMLDLAMQYMDGKDWHNAATVYEIVAREVLDNYESLYDEDGEIGSLVNDCVEKLGQCLQATADAALREAILRALFDLYRRDMELGGLDLGGQGPEIIEEHASDDEKRRVANWVREALANGPRRDSRYVREALGIFLLDLTAEDMDDQTFLDTTQELGLTDETVERLLVLQRVDEAIAIIEDAADHELTRFAEQLVRHGHTERARAIVRGRGATSQDDHLLQWLKDKAKQAGDIDEALTLAEQLFWARPAIHKLDELKELAQERGRWDTLRAEIVERWTAQGKNGLLTEFHLGQGDVRSALETVERTSPTSWGWDQPAAPLLRLEVAKAAEAAYPRDAIRLYMEAVRRLIEQQGRDNYATAATYLLRIRDMYVRLDEEATWETLIADLRNEYQRRPALQQEWDDAGL